MDLPSAGSSDQASTPAGTAGVGVSASARDRRIAEAGVLLTVLVWSANFVVVKASLGVFGPLTFAAFRYVVAAATLFLLLRLRHGSIRWPAGSGRTLLGLGVIGFGAYQVLWTIGLTQITAGNSALLVATSPVLTALLAGAVGMDRLTRSKLAGALVSFVGVALVVVAGHGIALGSSVIGDLMTLGSAALWAVYTTEGARMLRRVDPLQATAWAVLGGALFLLPFGIWEALSSPPSGVTAAALAGVLYSGALAAGVANVLVFSAIRLLGPTRVIANQFLVPAGAVVLGALLLGEPVGFAQLAGGAIIVLGLWLTRRATAASAARRTPVIVDHVTRTIRRVRDARP